MAFPSTPLEVRVDLAVDGAWTDITGDVLVRDSITVTRGRADEAAQADPSTTALTLENRDGRYSPRNPLGAYYGQIGRNTPMRVGVGSPPIAAAAPNQTQEGITDITAPSVTAEATGMLFCVWGALIYTEVDVITGPAGFTMGIEQHGLASTWNGGAKAILSAGATGASVATLTDDIADAVALSVAVPGVSSSTGFPGISTNRGYIGVTVTGVVAGQYLLAVQGWSHDDDDGMHATPAIDSDPAPDWLLLTETRGLFSDMHVRAWIYRVPAGAPSTLTVRFARYDSPGIAPMSGYGDNFGRVWRITGATEYHPRHVGEVSAWPQRWDLSGVDVHSPVTSSGVLRRLGQGASPLRSAIARHITRSAGVVAYWPLEDPSGATSFSSPVPGVAAGEMRGAPELAADAAFLGSEPLPTFQAAGFVGSVPAYSAAVGQLFAGALYAIPAGGMAASGANLLSIGLSGGTLSRAILEYRTTGDLAVKLVDKANVPVANTSFGFDLDGDRFFAWLALTQSGADITWKVCAIALADGDYSPAVSYGSGTTTAQTLGKARSVMAGVEGDINGPLSLTVPVTIGHVVVGSSAQSPFRSDVVHYYPALVGHFSEGAHERIVRLCREEGVDVLGVYDQPEMTGPYATDSTALGAQRAGTFVDLLREAADADGGMLFEPRGFLGLAYRPRDSRTNQAAAHTLSYTAGHIAEPFEPVDDDQTVRNDVTVTRIGGASARAEATTGPLSTLPPPDGVGRYDEALDLSLWRDSQAADVAGWRLHLGTWDEARYPQVTTFLEKTPADVPAVAGLDCGDRVDLTGLPAWLPPGPAEIAVEGYAETLEPFAWRMTLNASPAGPYRVAELDAADYGRLDSDDSTLTLAATSSATSLTVDVADGSPQWITTASHPTEFPFDITAAGEQITVSGIADAVSDTFGRVVVNSWGTSSSGHAWTISGTAANFDVTGSAGTWTGAAAAGTTELASVVVGVADMDLYVDFTLGVTPTGSDISAELHARRGSTADVIARLSFTTAGALNLQLFGNDGSTSLGSKTGWLTGVIGTAIRVRLRVVGTSLYLKVWRATSAEPGAWTLTATDVVAAAAGGAAVQFWRAAGNTNSNPVVTVDNFRVAAPQVFTVTRSVNGVVKAQSAGTQVSLHKPVFVPQGGDS